MKLSLVCTGTLHNEVGRLAIMTGQTALERVDDRAATEQVLHGTHTGRTRLRCRASVYVGPGRSNQRPTSVGKHDDQVELTLAMRASENGKRFTFEGMLWTSNLDELRRVLEMGSVSCLP
jgi:hypothetical protein